MSVDGGESGFIVLRGSKKNASFPGLAVGKGASAWRKKMKKWIAWTLALTGCLAAANANAKGETHLVVVGEDTQVEEPGFTHTFTKFSVWERPPDLKWTEREIASSRD